MISLMAAYGLKELLVPFVNVSRRKDETRGRRRKRILFGVSRELGLIFVIFIFLGILPTIWGTADASLRPTSLASSGVPALFGDAYPPDWMQALSWMKDNLPDDAVVQGTLSRRLEIAAAPGEYEPASFVVSAARSIDALAVRAADLKGDGVCGILLGAGTRQRSYSDSARPTCNSSVT